MPYPTLEKSYQFDLGRDLGRESYTVITREVKNAWKAFPQNPPVVKGSSNGVTAGMDGVDRWGTNADLVGNTSSSGARSWLTLRTAAGCELLFDIINIWGSPDVTDYTIYFSGAAGFTGGTITSRPTAADEVCATSTGAAWRTIDSAQPRWFAPSAATRLQMLHSTDGRETRMVLTGSSQSTKYLISWMIGETTGGTSSTFWVIDSFFYPGATSLYNLQVDDRGCMVGVGGQGRRAKMVLENSHLIGPPMGLATTTVPNGDSGKWPFVPMRLMVEDGTFKTRVGRIKDTWAGSQTNPTGTGYMDLGQRKFMQLGGLIVPWNNSVVVLE